MGSYSVTESQSADGDSSGSMTPRSGGRVAACVPQCAYVFVCMHVQHVCVGSVSVCLTIKCKSLKTV
jgi:hypothetical protein